MEANKDSIITNLRAIAILATYDALPKDWGIG